jgi:hypothetical protein
MDLETEFGNVEMTGDRSQAQRGRTPETFRLFQIVAILCVTLMVAAPPSFSQTAPAGDVRKPGPEASQTFKPHIILLPIVYYTPETRLALGAGGVLNYRLGREKEKARPSSLWLLLIYTQNSQIQLQLRPEIYLSNNSYILNATVKYERFPLKFFGIGNDVSPAAAEVYTPETIALSLSLKRRIIGNVFGGIQYQLEKTIIQEVEAGGLLASGLITGSTGGVISGLGLNLSWDNRDNVLFPRRGSYLQVVAESFGSVLGSDYHYSVSRIDLRTYVPVMTTHVLALQVYIRNMKGNPPFYQLSMLGGPSIMRGTYSGLYRDKTLLAVQAEYRMPVWKRFGMVGFVGMGNVAAGLGSIELDHLRYSLGGGLRYKIDSREGTNLRLDLAWGKASHGLYMTVQEAF